MSVMSENLSSIEISTGSVTSVSQPVEWKIPVISELLAANPGSVLLCSPVFQLFQRSWRLEVLKPVERRVAEAPREMSVHLRMVASENPVTLETMTCTFGIKKADGAVLEVGPPKAKIFESENPLVKQRLMPFGELEIRKAEMLSLETLTVTCRMHYPTSDGLSTTEDERWALKRVAGEIKAGSSSSCKRNKLKELRERSAAKLMRDMKSLMDSQSCDVVLRVADKEFRAHRCILETRSRVLPYLLRSEYMSGEVVIRDCGDPAVFGDFLHYMYTARVEHLTPCKALNLYTTAIKMGVSELKEECVEVLKGSISVENFCDVYSLSLRYQESELLSEARSFFSRYAPEILRSTKWIKFLTENTMLGNRLFLELLTQNRIGSSGSS